MGANQLPYILIAEDEQYSLLQLEGELQDQYHVLNTTTGQILDTDEVRVVMNRVENGEISISQSDGFHGDRRWQINVEDVFGDDSLQRAGRLSAEQLEVTRQILLSSFR